MIINKKFTQLKGIVEYEIVLQEERSLFHDCDCDEEFEIFEFENFSNLKELEIALSDETINKIKKDYEEIYSSVEEVIITNIIFTNSSEDTKLQSRISVSKVGVHGWATVEIDNKDIEHRLVSNLEQVKRIIDNTLEEYPIKFTRE